MDGQRHTASKSTGKTKSIASIAGPTQAAVARNEQKGADALALIARKVQLNANPSTTSRSRTTPQKSSFAPTRTSKASPSHSRARPRAVAPSSFSLTSAIDRLYVWVPRHVDPVVAVHEDLFVTLVVDGVEATSTATVEVLAYARDDVDAPVFARITIEGDGWDVHGTIAGPDCELFRDPCL